MSDRGLLLLSLVAAVALGALACYCLYAALVQGGRVSSWLEDRGCVYLAVFAAGCAVLVVSCALPIWPLAPAGAALVSFATARYFWLNV